MRLPPWMWKVIRSRKARIALACAPFALCLLVLLFYFGTHWWGRSQARSLLRDFESAGYVVDPEKYWYPAENPQDDLFQDPLYRRELEARVLGPLNPSAKMTGLARRLPRGEMGLAQVTDLASWTNPRTLDDRTAAELLLKHHHAAVERLEALRPVLARSKQAVWPAKVVRDRYAGETGPLNVSEAMMKLRLAAEAAAEIAILHLAAGDPDRAAEAVHVMLDVIRLELDPKPTQVSVLIADVMVRRAQEVIWEGVVRGGWSDRHLQAFDRSLAALRPQQAAVNAHLGEIALLRSHTGWLLTSTRVFPEVDLHRPGSWDPLEIWEEAKSIVRQLRPPGLEVAEGVKWEREYLDRTARSGGAPRERFTPEDLAEFRKANESDTDSPNFVSGANLLNLAATSALRMETTIALTRTGIALERYSLRAGKNAYPAALEALVPDFLPEVPADPMGVGKLHYRLQADGSPHVWSVGGNFTDNGGRPHREFAEGDRVWITRPIPGFTKKDFTR